MREVGEEGLGMRLFLKLSMQSSTGLTLKLHVMEEGGGGEASCLVVNKLWNFHRYTG